MSCLDVFLKLHPNVRHECVCWFSVCVCVSAHAQRRLCVQEGGDAHGEQGPTAHMVALCPAEEHHRGAWPPAPRPIGAAGLLEGALCPRTLSQGRWEMQGSQPLRACDQSEGGPASRVHTWSLQSMDASLDSTSLADIRSPPGRSVRSPNQNPKLSGALTPDEQHLLPTGCVPRVHH